MRHLLFKLHLDSVDVDTLADHQDVVVERCIPNEDLPGHRYERTSEQRGNNIHHWDVKHQDTRRVLRQVGRQHFLWEHEKAETISEEDIVLNVVDLIIVCFIISGVVLLSLGFELLIKRPVAVWVVGHYRLVAIVT